MALSGLSGLKTDNQRSIKLLPLFLLGNTVVVVAIFVILLIQTLYLGSVARKPIPSLVQLSDGHSTVTTPLGHNERSPKIIYRFTQDLMTLMFTWRGTLMPVADGDANNPPHLQPDPGVAIANSRITTASYESGFALSEDFRNDFLTEIAKLTPPDVFGGNTRVMLNIDQLSAPMPVAPPTETSPGKWKLRMVAHLMVFTGGDRLGHAISFNKEIFVQSIDPPSDILSTDRTPQPIEKLVNNVRQSGLQIYAIRELPIEDMQ